MYAHQSISSVHRLGSKLFERPSYIVKHDHGKIFTQLISTRSYGRRLGVNTSYVCINISNSTCDVRNSSAVKINEIGKSNMAAGRHHEKSENRDISTITCPNLVSRVYSEL